MDFKNIDKKYRPVPFWSWNEKLNVPETLRQVGLMDDVGEEHKTEYEEYPAQRSYNNINGNEFKRYNEVKYNCHARHSAGNQVERYHKHRRTKCY